VQVMTIHKAKGLEFGTVIVPGLDRTPRASDRPLFAWKARSDGALMMAPLRAAGETDDPAYDYLLGIDEAAAGHELERLLYVAATRAVNRLHLLGFACVEKGSHALRAPSQRSLLGKAWAVAREHFERALEGTTPTVAPRIAPEARNAELRMITPSALDVRIGGPAAASTAPPSEAPPAIEFSWVGETARHVGIVTHRWLQRIAADGAERWDAARIAALAGRIAGDLARRGIPAGERAAAASRVTRALEGAIADDRGQWLLRSRDGARSEYRVRLAGPEGVRLVVIDRTFVDADGRRWIVDYKTSLHEGAEPERFLDRELERYSPQLSGYAAAFPGESVALGLYLPLMKGWRELAA